MERLVQIKIIFIIVVTLFTTNSITAQQKIDKDIIFSFKGKRKNSYIPLHNFLANYKFDDKNLEKCMTASGIIKFQITPKGKIVSVETEGNLPDDLIKLIKERIFLTEGHWVFSDSILKAGKNIEFYYPFYLDINVVENCNLRTHESYDLLRKLFGDKKILHIRDEIYFIAPDFWSAVR